MTKESQEILNFLSKFQICIQEYRRQQRECRGTDDDIAYYYDNKLKKWLIDHEKEIRELSKMNCERPFISFVIHYIFPVKNN